MSLPDQHTSMMDGFGQTTLENLGLQPSLQEIFDLEGQHVIETHAGLVQHTDAHETADEGVTLEETLGVLVVELEELTGCTSDFGEDEGDTPDLALVAEAVFTCELDGIEWVEGMVKEGQGTVKTFSSASRRADSKGRRGTL